MVAPSRKALETLIVKGNFIDDQHIFELAHEVLTDTQAPMEDKIAALYKLNEVVGEDLPCNEEAVAEYLQQTEGF